jgi:membrane peptidoglycan carboxypeptidase
MTGLSVVAGVLLAGVLAPSALGAGLLSNEVGDSVAAIEADLAAEKPPLTTTVTDRDGHPIAVLYDQYRLPVGADGISSAMKAAIIAIEDRRFYDEGAVDPRGVLRALVNNAAGGDTQGASTITQQYVKNFLINVVHRGDPAAQQRDRENSVARKLREAKLAVQVDRSMTKDEILAGYLNVIQFSGTVYGVAAAAEAYFGTNAAKLTLPQAALLAGMVNSPSRYDPYAHPAAAKARRDVVLDAMADAGSLPVPAAREAKATALGVLPGHPGVRGQYVRRSARGRLGARTVPVPLLHRRETAEERHPVGRRRGARQYDGDLDRRRRGELHPARSHHLNRVSDVQRRQIVRPPTRAARARSGGRSGR